MPRDPSDLIDLAPGVSAAPDAVRIAFARSSGPGGQNVNKVNTKAELWLPLDCLVGLSESAMQRLVNAAGRRITDAGELHLTCEESRSAEANRRGVLDRLREMIIQAQIEPRRRRKTRPSRASKMRRLETKKRRSDVKSNRRSSFDH